MRVDDSDTVCPECSFKGFPIMPSDGGSCQTCRKARMNYLTSLPKLPAPPFDGDPNNPPYDGCTP